MSACAVLEAPLLEGCFSHYQQHLLSAIAPWHPVPLDVPQEFARREGGGATLLFERFATDRGELRWTRVLGARVDIVCCMHFPNDAATFPVFAAEVVAFRGVARVAVVDFQPACGVNRAEQELGWWPAVMESLERVHRPYRELPTGGPMPEWCLPHFTPFAVFSRPAEAGFEANFEQAFDDYARAYARLTNEVSGVRVEADDRALDDYKQHHITHSPGVPYLSKVFGVEWTERFLRLGMYA